MSSQSIDHAWRVFENAQAMVRLADQKLQVSLALGTGLTGLQAASLWDGCSPFSWAFAGAVFWFFVFALTALLSRGPSQTPAETPKLLYFGHIASLKQEEFAQRFMAMDDSQRLQDLVAQVYEVSAIAKRKFVLYQLSWLGLVVALLATLGGMVT